MGKASFYYKLMQINFLKRTLSKILFRYAETYCFVKGSYFLPIDDEIDDSYSKREKIYIGYYQVFILNLLIQH